MVLSLLRCLCPISSYYAFIVLFSILFSAELNLFLLCFPLLFVFMVGIVLSSKVFVTKELYKCMLFSMSIFFIMLPSLSLITTYGTHKTFVVKSFFFLP